VEVMFIGCWVYCVVSYCVYADELSVSILRWPYVLSLLRARVMAASSALLIVCLSFCDFMSMCVTLCVRGLTTPASSVLLPLTCEPSV